MQLLSTTSDFAYRNYRSVDGKNPDEPPYCLRKPAGHLGAIPTIFLLECGALICTQVIVIFLAAFWAGVGTTLLPCPDVAGVDMAP